MISLGLGQSIVIYTSALVMLVFLAWAFHEYRCRRREIRSRRKLLQCILCGTLYECPASDTLPVCPQCGQPNERRVPDGP